MKNSIYPAVAVVLGLSSGISQAAIVNGGFETGAFPPWQTIGVASVETAAFGTAPTEGAYQGLIETSEAGGGAVSDTDIENFLGLTAGSLDAVSSTDAVNGSAMKQQFTAAAGETISLDWNFLTNEPAEGPNSDFSFVSIVVDNVLQILADATSPALSPSATAYSDETGYSPFTHTLTTGGTVELGLGVMNAEDALFQSALLVDNVKVSGGETPVPEPATFALLAMAWAGVGFFYRRRLS